MKRIIIRNKSDATEGFACLLVGNAMQGAEEVYEYKDIRVRKVSETDENVIYSVKNF